MAVNKITVTLITGPAQAVTAQVINNVSNVEFDIAEQVLRIRDTNSRSYEFDLSGAVTVTYTISGGIATIAVSS